MLSFCKSEDWRGSHCGFRWRLRREYGESRVSGIVVLVKHFHQMYLMVLSDVDKVPYNQEKNLVLINLVPWLFWWHQKSHQTDAVTELSKFEKDSKTSLYSTRGGPKKLLEPSLNVTSLLIFIFLPVVSLNLYAFCVRIHTSSITNVFFNRKPINLSSHLILIFIFLLSLVKSDNSMEPQLDSKQGEVHADGSHQFSNQILWKKN